MKQNNTYIKIYANVVDSKAHEQIKLIADSPAIKGLVAIMPDVHFGKGSVIGFTGKFGDKVIPNIIGVDIGCGVVAYPLKKININFEELDKYIRENIPLGFNKRDISMKEQLAKIPFILFSKIEEAVKIVIGKGYSFENQIGTLGGGNHFIEIGKDEEENKYLLIHSGSRNFGKQVAEYHQKKAKELCKSMGVGVAQDLEYLPLNYGGEEYLTHMRTAQEFAKLNREAMLKIILRYLDIKYIKENKIESVHNFIAEDNIIRKGAIQSYTGQKVVVPFNMTEGSIIGVGKSNKDYNFSAPHGSGRMYGRNVMKNKLRNGEITMQDFKNSMVGIFSTSIKESTIDESKFAYKTYEDIKEHLEQTIDIQVRIKPIYNLKSS